MNKDVLKPDGFYLENTEVATEASLPVVPVAPTLRLCPQAQLVVLMGAEAGKRIPIVGEAIIGRAKESTVSLPEPHVSRRHACVWQDQDGGNFFVVDLGSRNGTEVNTEPVGRAPRPLEFGEHIRIGQQTLLLFTRKDDLEEQILQSQKLEALGKLARGVAHDFNNLLAIVSGNVDMLRTTVRDNRENECLDDIHTAVQRAAELTRSLLRFAQRERSDRQLTSLSQVTDEVIQISRRTFPPAISINGSIAPHLHVLGLQSQLHQVVMNLLFNARDAVDGSGMIWVKVEPITAGEMPFVTKAPFVLLSVSDNGVGMDRATQDKAFEPFFSTKPTSKGTGLGLSTVYGIVRTYGGRILVDSKVGEGSTFRVYLPAVERPTAPASDHRTPTDELVEQGAVALSPDEF